MNEDNDTNICNDHDTHVCPGCNNLETTDNGANDIFSIEQRIRPTKLSDNIPSVEPSLKLKSKSVLNNLLIILGRNLTIIGHILGILSVTVFYWIPDFNETSDRIFVLIIRSVLRFWLLIVPIFLINFESKVFQFGKRKLMYCYLGSEN